MRLKPTYRDLFRRRNIHDEISYWYHKLARRIGQAPIRWGNVAQFLGAVLLAFGATLALIHHAVPQEAALMGGIFVLAALLWVTEALPLFATALLIIGLEVVLLANPGQWAGLGFTTGQAPPYRVFLAPLSDPIIVLFLGGFMMAQAAIKVGVDKTLAALVLTLFGGQPSRVMLGMMVVTAVFSMWMSNTATTAMMITLVVPLLGQFQHADPMRKALLLAIPFAANIGGMGTPIASPPNAVAIASLQQAGLSIGFGTWMLIAAPLVVGLLLVSWGLLRMVFRSPHPPVTLRLQHTPITPQGWFVIGVFGVTITLWLTDWAHGLPTAVTALLPAIVFTATGLIGRRDFNSLEWHILILIAGGIALGTGMQQTGLDAWLIGALPLREGVVAPVLIVATVVFSTFMSNTAAANLLLPIGVSLALSLGSGSEIVIVLVVSVALAASTAMALPISTPPNAIAYAHGELTTRDVLVSGSLIGLLAMLLVLALVAPVVQFWLGVF